MHLGFCQKIVAAPKIVLMKKILPQTLTVLIKVSLP